MRALVLGGTGLISQELVQQLVALGDQVTVVNRGRSPDLLPQEVVRVRGERQDLAALRPMVERTGYDAVVDMIGFTQEEADQLVALAQGAIGHVLYCSTTDVFEKPQPHYPVRETARRAARSSFAYALGKVASEEVLEAAAARGGFELTILRPAQTYGGPHHGPVHPLGHREYQIWRLRQGRPLLLHGDGSSLWAAAHARDVAAAFVAAAHQPIAKGRAYNLASEELLTWSRYWRVVGEAFGRPEIEIVTVPSELLAERFGEDGTWLLENFRFNSVFDCSAAAEQLDFAARTSFAQGIAESAEAFGELWTARGAAESGSRYHECYEATLSWRLRWMG